MAVASTRAAPAPQPAANGTFRPASRLKRAQTAIRAFRVLKHLTPQQVDSFMQSYVIYDLDWADEKQMIQTLGPEYQYKVGACLADYYSVLNHLCAIGGLEKMYIPPAMDLHLGLAANQLLYEESVAQELHLSPGAKLLDLGCGRGRVAAHMTSVSGAQITGLNIDADQIASARAFNAHMKYDNTFVCADFNDLPLPLEDCSFDGFYQIQAFSLSKDIPKLCRELFRVLKPGARLSLVDWASLDAYDPDDPHHAKLMRAIKPLIGAIGTPTPESLTEALKGAGFRMLEMNNASIDGLQAPLIEQADSYFRAARATLLGFVKLGLLPAHFRTLFDRLTQDCDAFVEADRKRLITTSYHWLAEKPADEKPTDPTTAPVTAAPEEVSEARSGRPDERSATSSPLPHAASSAASSDTAVETS